MGLDGVELVMAIEEEFGVSLPDEDIVNFVTVGDTFEYLKKSLGSSPPAHCAKQRIFFKLRSALCQNYKLKKNSIKTNTKLANIVPERELKEGWPYLSCYFQLEFPDYETPLFLFGPKLKAGSLTVGEIVTAMVSLNADKILPEQNTHDEVWVRLSKLIQNQLSVSSKEVQLHSKFVDDLGIG